MPNARRIAEQWLEAETAFGVTEVPIAPRSARPNALAAPVVETRAVPAPVSPSHLAHGAPVVLHTAAPPLSSDDAMAQRSPKTAPVLPSAPEGAIADLPAINREQKTAQLAALEERAALELAPHFTEISTRLVFGEGDPDAPILFIGEGPGIEEDRLGRPFVGRSGQLLDKQILAMGYQRAQIYIANIVKLRAANFDQAEGRVKDRPPTPEEVARQIHILHEQIAIIRPKAIITLGAPAIKWLTGTTEGVMKIRGTWLDHRGIPVMPTYHPAFLLRAYTPENRKKVWEDLQKVMERVGKLK